MKTILTVLTIFAFWSVASAGSSMVDVTKCEDKIRQVKLTSFQAGQAWSELSQSRKDKDYERVEVARQKMVEMQSASDRALGEAIYCLYE